MTDIPSVTFFNFFLYLLIPFLIAIIFKKNKISPLIGYILGGIVIGNFFNSLFAKQTINNFAYFGIILLTFTIGLEIQFERILTLKKYIVIGGLLQLIFSIICIFFLSHFFGFSLLQSFLLGLAFSSSSTTLVGKIIQDKGEESSFHGELALGMLMFQDIAFIPFMIVFSSLTTANIQFNEIFKKIVIDIFFSAVILISVYYSGRKIIPYLFNRVAKLSRELLNLLIIIFIFFIAYFSSLFHVPILVSVFVAGIIIGQTTEHYHIFSQIRPLRDLLAIMFFIFIGTTINISFIYLAIPKIILFASILVFIKAVIVLLIFLFFRFGSKLSFYLSSFLFQIDEDAFILMSLAYSNKLFSQEEYLFIVGTIMVTLIISPLFINNKGKTYLIIRSFLNKVVPQLDHFIKHRVDSDRTPIDVLQIKNHVVICGYGRVGAYVGRALMLSNIPFIAIDYNFSIVEKAKKEGVNIIYGDPTDFDILDYTEVENALALVLVVPNRISQEAIILNAKKLNRQVTIISRIHKKNDQRRMKDLGVDLVVQPEFEASISIIKRLFLMSQLPKEEIVKKIQYFKLEQEGI